MAKFGGGGRGGGATVSIATDEVQPRVSKHTMGRYQGKRVRLLVQMIQGQEPRQPSFQVLDAFDQPVHVYPTTSFWGEGDVRWIYVEILGTVVGPDTIQEERITCFDNANGGGFDLVAYRTLLEHLEHRSVRELFFAD